MKDHVEIEVIVDSLLVSDLHETIASILTQCNLAILDIHLRFTNRSHLDLTTEEASLLNAGKQDAQNANVPDWGKLLERFRQDDW